MSAGSEASLDAARLHSAVALLRRQPTSRKESPSPSLPRDCCRGFAAAHQEARRARQLPLQSRHTFRGELPAAGSLAGGLLEKVRWKRPAAFIVGGEGFLETGAGASRPGGPSGRRAEVSRGPRT